MADNLLKLFNQIEGRQLRLVRLEAPTHRKIPHGLYAWGVGVLVALVTVLVLP